MVCEMAGYLVGHSVDCLAVVKEAHLVLLKAPWKAVPLALKRVVNLAASFVDWKVDM